MNFTFAFKMLPKWDKLIVKNMHVATPQIFSINCGNC